jgi:hypothetical protein
MEDYIHVAKVGRHLAMEFAQSYLKGYASTWWRTMKQEERKTHGYTWEFFRGCVTKCVVNSWTFEKKPMQTNIYASSEKLKKMTMMQNIFVEQLLN